MDADQQAEFEAEVARIRASGILSRSQGLLRLFDYLADPVRRGQILRETEVAPEVFGRLSDEGGDASIRVYVHRLRRKLEAFYAAAGTEAAHRLVIPVGEYRLRLDGATDRPRRRGAVGWRRWLVLTAVLAAVNLAGWAGFTAWRGVDDQTARLAKAPLWSDLDGARPILVVVGDYYIFGDTGGGVVPERMIRSFEINSPGELDAFLLANPDYQGRYVDLESYYTPVGATRALRDVLGVVIHIAGRSRPVDVITSSQLTPEMLKTSDIVYLGYFSSLRLLEDGVFERSRFRLGDSFDELTDQKTGKRFLSTAGLAGREESSRDLGYVARFTTPAGAHRVIIAGTRDVGLMQAAELAADPKLLSQMRAKPGAAVEALYEVRGLGGANLSAAPVGIGP